MTRNGLKWYCAVSSATLGYANYDFRGLIAVAVGSAIRNTRLRPHLIYDGPPDAFSTRISELGAVVIHHRTPLCDALSQAADGFLPWLHTAAGAYLRFEIPALESEEKFVLYTDCDVLFLRDPSFAPAAPATFGASSEFAQEAPYDLNSGVMLINLPAMRSALPAIYGFARLRLQSEQILDQDILRELFGGDYLFLDRGLNWKPYWGWNENAQIVHFHGPKPIVAREFLVDGSMPASAGWAGLLTWSRDGYEAYTRLWFVYRDVLLPQMGYQAG